MALNSRFWQVTHLEGNRPGTPGRQKPKASKHRHRGAKPPLQLASESMGPLSGNEAHLFDGLAAAAKGHCVALMAIGLDAIWIDMHHQSTDLAAGTGGDPHGRNGVGHRPSASRLSGCKDCGAARPDPCCRLGGGQCGGGPWRCFGDLRGAQGGVRSGEHGVDGSVVALCVTVPWAGEEPLGALSAGECSGIWSKPSGRVGRLGWCNIPKA
jgi:hypothetical protein